MKAPRKPILDRAKQINDRRRKNQLTGFYLMATLAFNELTLTDMKYRPLKCFLHISNQSFISP